MRLFLIGTNVADDSVICDLGVLGDFVYVDEKKVLVPCLFPSPWKRRQISLDMPLLRFIFQGPCRFRYPWALPVLGKMTAFPSLVAMLDCRLLGK